MSLEQLLKFNKEYSKRRDILDAISKGAKLVQVEGLAAAAKGFLLAGVFSHVRRTTLILTYTQEQAERITEDLPIYGIPEEQVLFFPPSDSLIYEEGSPNYSIIGERLAALQALTLAEQPLVIVAPINAALRRTMPRNTLVRSYATVNVGEDMNMDKFAALLVSMGYEVTDVVDRHGEFSRRGGLIDVFPSNSDLPLRIELFGDEIESLRHFDSATQRSTGKVQSSLILPSREVLLDEDNSKKAVARIRKELEVQLKSMDGGESARRLSEKVEEDIHQIEQTVYFDELEYYLPYLLPEEISIFDYLPPDAMIVLDEPMQIKSHWERLEEQMVETMINRSERGLLLTSQRKQHVPFEATIKHTLAQRQGIAFTLLPRSASWARPDAIVQIDSAPMEGFGGHMEAVIDQIKTWDSNGLRTVIATAQDRRMLEILGEYDVKASSIEGEAESNEEEIPSPLPNPQPLSFP
ncbi:MAG: hypothetical protein NT018_09500, partial [Armatimonadetes bacterium]|nr:hypothetical protein [Armatimonadota bacterium]